MKTSRRELLSVVPAIAAAAGLPESSRADQEILPPSRFTLGINLELMFDPSISYEDRLRAVIQTGAKHYAFWQWQGKNLGALLEIQHSAGLGCISITGNPKTGWTTGLTKPGMEQAFLDDITECCEVANRFGCDNLITFVGATQPDYPKAKQDAQIIAGLKKAGEIAEQHNVYITLEPLNRVESPQMTMLTAADAFRYCEGTDHPHVRVDYDMYHRQLGEGNLIENLREGMTKKFIRFIEIGDVPGRYEPGTGEANYINLFRELRRIGYSGYIGMEHRTTRNVQYAWNAVRKAAGLA